MNRLQALFQQKNKDEKTLSIFFTAGYPQINDTLTILETLQDAGVDLVEIGIPFSDPLADGPVIQESSAIALKNGMNLNILFQQLKKMRSKIHIPVVLMGYFNPIFTYGVENFLNECQQTGVDGAILPDLPLDYYKQHYKTAFEQRGIAHIFLVSPQTSEQRIHTIDQVSSNGFIYAVSSSSTTGNSEQSEDTFNTVYLEKLGAMQLENPVLTGFNIKDQQSFQMATKHTKGGIIGTAFIKAIEGLQGEQLTRAIHEFVDYVKHKKAIQ